MTMNSNDLRKWVNDLASTLCFSHTILSPSFLQTFHRLAVDSFPATKGLAIPFDNLVQDMITGTKIKPSDMQGHLRQFVYPAIMIAIQSLAEDMLNTYYRDINIISVRIEQAVNENKITRNLASEAHYWRIVRNVIAHGNGEISQCTERDFQKLNSLSKILFTEFILWGPLVKTAEGTLAPITDEVVSNPRNPKAKGIITPITESNRLEVGLGDLLAAGTVWADVINLITGL